MTRETTPLDSPPACKRRKLRPMAHSVAIFDVDGTLVDSAQMIQDCVNLALRELGYPEQRGEQLRRWVGPPLSVSFRDFAEVPAHEIDTAIATYRRHYSTMMFDVPIFDGIIEALETLRTRGVTLAVATSKNHRYAEPILRELGLSPYFAHVCGARSDDPAYDKAQVILDALTLLRADGIATEDAVMIGDRHHDITGAHAHGLATIGVTWSGTDLAEFDTADAIAHTPAELVAMISG